MDRIVSESTGSCAVEAADEASLPDSVDPSLVSVANTQNST